MFYTGRLGAQSIHWYLYLSMKEFSFYNWTTGGKPEQTQGLFLWWIVNKKRGIIKCKTDTDPFVIQARILVEDIWTIDYKHRIGVVKPWSGEGPVGIRKVRIKSESESFKMIRYKYWAVQISSISILEFWIQESSAHVLVSCAQMKKHLQIWFTNKWNKTLTRLMHRLMGSEDSWSQFLHRAERWWSSSDKQTMAICVKHRWI